MKSFVSKKKHKKVIRKLKQMIQELCTECANSMQTFPDPKDNQGMPEEFFEPKSHGCILTYDAEVCDGCPVLTKCPNLNKILSCGVLS